MKLWVCLFFLPLLTLSQNREIDSLQKVVQSGVHDTIKLRALTDLNWALLSVNLERSKQTAFNELALAVTINNPKWIAQAHNDIGISYFKLGILDSALSYFNRSLLIRKELKDPALIASSISKIAMIYYELGQYDKSLENHFNALKIFEKSGDSHNAAIVLNNIGQVYYKLKNPNKEIEYGEKALAIHLKNKNEYQAAFVYGNLGNTYKQIGNPKKSLEYFNLALPIFLKYGDRSSEASVYSGLAMNFRADHKNKEALEYYKKAFDIAVEIKDKLGVEQFGHNISCTLSDMGKYEEALTYSLESLNSTDKNNKSQLLLCYRQLATIYAFTNKGKESKFYLDKFANLKDTVFSKNSGLQIAEMETKYDVEKKDLQLLANEKQIEKEKAQRYFIISALLFFVLLFMLAIWAFIQKRKNSNLLQEKNNLLEGANQKISHQKEELLEKQKEIVDSINYAKKIQNALLASEELLMKNLVDHFILFKPKDIVSGDFTWATIKDNLFYLACCDSTGHGVPGAFMSLLNIGFLSEAIKERNITEPGKIFDYTRQRLIETIGGDDQKDGFDGILLCMNLHSKQITYAAANNSPVLIRNKELSYMSVNKMPVGEGIKTDLFDTFAVHYEPGDTLYLYTDGYPDQFGGSKGKKFKYKQLEQLLSDLSDKPVNYQKEKLNSEFENWKGSLEQVDDVCVIGIKL